MTGLNDKFCDNGTAIRDMAEERNTLWRMASWQSEQISPAGMAYGHGATAHLHQPKPDASVVFQYTLKGVVHFKYKGQNRDAPAGYAYIFQSGEEPRWTTVDDPEYRCLWVNLSGAGLVEHWQLIRDVHGPAIALDLDGQVIRACKKIISLRESGGDISAEALSIHAFVMALYQHCEQGQIKKLQPVQRAIQHIIRYPFHSASLKQIAKEHQVSREHLGRVFMQEMGMAPATWLREERYRRAKELLIKTSIPIQEVAYQVGFGSVDALARMLQEQESLSPSSFRAQFAAKPVLPEKTSLQ